VFDGTNVTIGATSNSYGGKLGVFSSGNTRLDIATTSPTAQQILSFGQNGTAKWQVISDLAASGSGDLDFVVPGSGSRFKFNSSGAIGLSGSNYGSSGQVLTSNGSGSAPSWQTVSGGIQLDTNTSATATDYAIGSYLWAPQGAGSISFNQVNATRTIRMQNGAFSTATSGGTALSGSWKLRSWGSLDNSGWNNGDWGNNGGTIGLFQRTA